MTGKSTELSWQPSLLEPAAEVSIDEGFSTLDRIDLDESSWIDFAPRWVSGSDELFAEIVERTEWSQRSRKMYDKVVEEPRLTSSWKAASGAPLEPEIMERMRTALNRRYGIEFDSAGLNLYRDGNDSVAWHRDRIATEIQDPIVALVSIGQPRKFLLRPRANPGQPREGQRQTLLLGHGDLLVTGGQTQRTWEHAVPKVKQAGPRISIAFRHGMVSAAYIERGEDEQESDEDQHGRHN